MVRVTMNNGQVLEVEDDEIATLITEVQNDDGLSKPSSSSSHASHQQRPRIVVAKAATASSPLYRQSWCWAMMFLLAAVVALLATDSLQVNISLRGLERHYSKRKTSNSDDQQLDNDKENREEEEGQQQHQEQQKKTPAIMQAKAAQTGSIKSPASYPIRYRGPKLEAEQRTELASQWGQWSLTDENDSFLSRRPSLDCGSFPHCDIPRTSFPSHAWQTDAKFLQQFVTQGLELVARAQEAILAEYGHSKFDQPNLSFQERSAMFQLTMLDLKSGKDRMPGRKDNIENGGWTTPSSFQGLVRRLLHAIMTQDKFTFAMGGHSAATGHGNYFKQSYTMQFHKVMEPVFARLGVTLNSHNMAQGGLGTIQNSMAMGSLYGNEIDICMWDSGMTESSNAHYDVYARQALLGGNRVPLLWGGLLDVLRDLHKEADVDIGALGTGMKGIPVTENEEQAVTIPYAARFMRCDKEVKYLCEDNKYNAICWIDRPDVTPIKPQEKVVGGRASWHPGFRTHQLQGRILAFTVLLALQDGLEQWKYAEDYALPDSAWHVTDYYKNIRDKVTALTTTPCFTDTGANLPSTRICRTAMKGVSEFTPRFRPTETSIRSIMKDPSAIGPAPSNLYSGPDVYNPALEPGEGAINYLAIIENDAKRPKKRRQLVNGWTRPSNMTDMLKPLLGDPSFDRAAQRSLSTSSLVQGRGWSVSTKAGDIHCNGTWDSECSRGADDSCLLSGHNDGRGGLLFDSFSGWLLLNLKRVKEGIIIIKFESWHGNGANKITEGWTAENNGVEGQSRRRRRRLGHANFDFDDSYHRELGGGPELCDSFALDYAINGEIHSLNKDEFTAKRVMVQRVVETVTLLDDPNFTSNEMDVELGIRMRGCERTRTFSLTHVYWA